MEGEGTGEGSSRLPPVLLVELNDLELGGNLVVSGSRALVLSTGSPVGKKKETEAA